MNVAGKYRRFVLVLGTFALAAGVPLRGGERLKEFTFTVIDCAVITPVSARCGSDVAEGSVYTAPEGINDAGDISGIVMDRQGKRHGFLLRHGESTAIVIDYPGAAWTRAWGINSQGDVAGTWGPGSGAGSDTIIYGFVRSRNGQFTDVKYPEQPYEVAQRITSSGVIVGCYHGGATGMRGFVRFRDGSFEDFSLAESMHLGATPDGSRIVGIYSDASGTHSYLLDDGLFAPFDVPESNGRLTWAFDINPHGDIVGHYRDSFGLLHGFLRDANGKFATLDIDPARTAQTQPRSVNAHGEIAGLFVEGGKTRGFIARPISDK